MENNNEVLLKVEHLCQYFKMGKKQLKAVDDVNFEIKKGEVFGLVGESGCGKTTTGRSIIKLYDITSGSVYFKGVRVCAGTQSYKDAIKKKKVEVSAKIKELKEEAKNKPELAEKSAAEIEKLTKELNDFVSEQKKLIANAVHDHKHCDRDHADKLTEQVEAEYAPKLKTAENDPEALKKVEKEYRTRLRIAKKSRLTTQIQMIFQDPIASLDPRMTVKEIISEGLVISGIKDKEYIDEKVYEILETVGLVREHAGRYPHEFSGGQRQRIGIARALAVQPDFIVCDEPISALDVSIQAQVVNLMQKLQHEQGLTYLFIAHDLSMVKYISDRIGVMHWGKLLEVGPADEIYHNPIHPYTKSLLSAIPEPDPERERKRQHLIYDSSIENDGENRQMYEIRPGHFVYATEAEAKNYKEETKSN